jgi:DeoR family transcriptional regulator, suf operon transcriptional repressor
MASQPLHPPAHSLLPTAYHGPRGDLLLELKLAGQLTARDFAAKLDLSLNAVRHHLKELEGEGLIRYHREQRGMGAPTFAYHLTAEGEGLFPQRQAELLTEVLERVAAQSGRGAIVSAMETRFADLARKLQTDLEGASPARRREVVLQALTEGGFMAEWTEGLGEYKLTEHHCAIRAVAERFPEICEAEAKFLHEVLAAAVEREAHILHGCTACEYKVRFPETGELTDLTGNRESHEESA